MSILEKIYSGLGRQIDDIVYAIDPVRGTKRRTMRAYSSSGYVVPGGPQKSMKGFLANSNSPAIDIDKKLPGMRAASRDFAMNNSVAVAIYRRFKTNVPGAGLKVVPRPDKDFLGISDKEAEEFKLKAIREFDLWAESLESDYTGTRSFDEDQALMYMASMINGDVFFALPWAESRRRNWPYETTIKIIDADLVRNPTENYFAGGTDAMQAIRNGVEYDSTGRIKSIHVANFYENDYSGDIKNRAFVEIPIYDDNGERQIFHLMEHDRIEQRRGIPLLAPVIEDLKNISRLSKSELTSALIASMFTVFVRDNLSLGGYMQQGFTPGESFTGGGGWGPEAEQSSSSLEHAWDYQMGHGNICYLDSNKTVEFADPKKNNETFEKLFQAMSIQISAVAEIPEEVAMLRFTKSYSAMRGAVLEAYKRWKVCQINLARRCCQPCYEAILREAILKGRINAKKFLDDPIYRAAWTRSTWIGPGMGQIDPFKEARASILKIGYGLSTREEEFIADRGQRWDPMLDRLAAENEKMVEKGLKIEEEEQKISMDVR